MTRPTLTRADSYDVARIYLNGILHLAFVRRDFVGLQSWKSASVYSIELTFRDRAAITLEYDDPLKWAAVLKLLEQELTP